MQGASCCRKSFKQSKLLRGRPRALSLRAKAKALALKKDDYK
jgi:hypothetical protein